MTKKLFEVTRIALNNFERFIVFGENDSFDQDCALDIITTSCSAGLRNPIPLRDSRQPLGGKISM